jgi:hypothetical protein
MDGGLRLRAQASGKHFERHLIPSGARDLLRRLRGSLSRSLAPLGTRHVRA